MRPRTFIMIIVLLLLVAVAVVLFIARSSGGGPLANLVGGGDQSGEVVDNTDSPAENGEPGVPLPTPTPEINLVQVVVAKTDLPVGTQLRPDLLDTEFRPSTNVALVGGYTFTDPIDLVNEIVKVDISQGQAILQPMLAVNPNDLAQFGSDLSLYVENGRLAVAFPINALSGAAYAMRPGDYVDIIMSLLLLEVDEEFGSPLPNNVVRIDTEALIDGTNFVQGGATTQGRLELVPELDLVAEIVPGLPSDDPIANAYLANYERGEQIPRRVTQHTIQQAEVLWIGTWNDQRADELPERDPLAEQLGTQEVDANGNPIIPTPTPVPQRVDNPPDVVILSMTHQDALALKWALETGIDITLALRAQGDNTTFATNSVSLPQIVEQGGLIRPEPTEFVLSPPWQEVPVPHLPIFAPGAPTE